MYSESREASLPGLCPVEPSSSGLLYGTLRHIHGASIQYVLHPELLIFEPILKRIFDRGGKLYLEFRLENGDLKKIFEILGASAPASAGGTDRDLAWTQLAQKLGI